jgi:glucose-1-phosphate thymidylyltransferase
MPHSSSVVGLIPAAGLGRRLAPLPCSKEVYPIGVVADNDATSVKVASQYLLESMHCAGVDTAYVVLRDGKWDIPAYWGNGHRLGMHLAYTVMERPHGTPYTLDDAYPFVRDRVVAMGFPDVLFEPADAFVHLLARQKQSRATIVLGLFPASHPEKVDMVRFDAEGRPCELVIKPAESDLTYTWVCAVWTASFTEYLHEHVGHAEHDQVEEELYVGDVIQEAIRDGVAVDAVCFPDGYTADIGTPGELQSTVRRELRRSASIAQPDP